MPAHEDWYYLSQTSYLRLGYLQSTSFQSHSFPAAIKPQPYNQNYSLTQPPNILGKSYVGKDGSSSIVSQKMKSLDAIPSPTDCAGITAKSSTQAKILQDMEREIFFEP